MMTSQEIALVLIVLPMLIANYFIIKAGSKRKVGSTIPFVIWLFFIVFPPFFGFFWIGFIFAPVISLIAVLASSKREDAKDNYYLALANIDNLHNKGVISYDEFVNEKYRLTERQEKNEKPNTLGVRLYVIAVVLLALLFVFTGLVIYYDRPKASEENGLHPLSDFWSVFVSSGSSSSDNRVVPNQENPFVGKDFYVCKSQEKEFDGFFEKKDDFLEFLYFKDNSTVEYGVFINGWWEKSVGQYSYEKGKLILDVPNFLLPRQQNYGEVEILNDRDIIVNANGRARWKLMRYTPSGAND